MGKFRMKIKKHMSVLLAVLMIGTAVPMSIFATDIASQFLTGTDAYRTNTDIRTDTDAFRTNTDAIRTNTDADWEEDRCWHEYSNYVSEDDGTEDMPASRTAYCINCGEKSTVSFYEYMSRQTVYAWTAYIWAENNEGRECSCIFDGKITENNIDELIVLAFCATRFTDSNGMSYQDNFFGEWNMPIRVPLTYMQELFYYVYGVENVDFSASERYDVKREILYDIGGIGTGPEKEEISFENGEYILRRYNMEYINDGEYIVADEPYIAITFDRDAHITGVYFPDIDKRNHNIVNCDAKAPTCTEVGWNAYEKCKYCDYTTYKEISALGHSYTSVVTEPTCTKDGYTTHTCSECGYVQKDSIVPALGHKEFFMPYIAPTCTQTGLSMGKGCETCGKTLISQQVLPATGHSFSNWITILEATCVTDGKRIKICSCGLFEEDTIISTGHNLTDWITVSDATCDENGKKIRLCFCGYSEQETIRAFGHADKNGDGYCEECSFNFNKESNSDTNFEKGNIFSTLKAFFNELFSFIEKIFVFWK